MPSTSASETSPLVNARESQRLQTRARLFDAAVAEIGRAGLAGADVAAIAAATGVARGTFYFHFPTKEHVLVELERAEEVKIVAKLAPKTSGAGDLLAMLRLLVRQVLAAEERLGPVVFRDMLGLHFSATRPLEDETAEHPLAEFVIAAIRDAQAAGRVARDADPGELGVIFMTGLFALLATSETRKTRAALLDRYVKTIVAGMEAT
ncbi:TetR family transcriptional regulator [Mycobacterium triplex]|uniref:TetR family transcriptional regulator n=1 Tax=Mycobacterium triplex TaxID=47839 RepID=A0A024JXW3_9MYCO|nr:TetR/AcrR family transcriptional regulator [Mycobacterium triplex]ORX07153.1 TetR family transcriptional regulator [Mycobacterium triplex]CDO88650.1 TetR family transcriptional regulator [Mycobacterium triplex]